MLLKVDENLNPDVADFLRQHGHDALSVYDQGLRGRPDGDIAAVCQRETRALITLDLDFADIRSYPPADYAGIIVLRVGDQSRAAVLQVMQRVVAALAQEPLAGHLWIVDETQIRIRPGS